jgi:hypothetical protein
MILSIANARTLKFWKDTLSFSYRKYHTPNEEKLQGFFSFFNLVRFFNILFSLNPDENNFVAEFSPHLIFIPL